MSHDDVQFVKAFKALTSYSPMRWQCRLFDQIMNFRLPAACDLPTGLGKTSVIPIWLIALALQANCKSINLPRRLIYIVNRRTVVDQATNIVELMRKRLISPDYKEWETQKHVLENISSSLRKLCAFADSLPIAISTLRGELADNEEWKEDPASGSFLLYAKKSGRDACGVMI